MPAAARSSAPASPPRHSTSPPAAARASAPSAAGQTARPRGIIPGGVLSRPRQHGPPSPKALGNKMGCPHSPSTKIVLGLGIPATCRYNLRGERDLMSPSAKSLAAAAVLAVCSASMAHAGTVYIPIPGVETIGNVAYEVRVSVTNPGSTAQSLKMVEIRTNTDGTKRNGVTPSTQAVQAGKTIVLKPSTAPGLLEISAPAGLELSARLAGVGQAAGLGTELPVITSETAGAANEKLYVQGLRNSTTRHTDVIMVNLGK